MKRFSLLSIITVLLLSVFITNKTSAQQFPDLPDWATKEILYLYEQDIVKGMPNGTFGSNNNIKRGDAALMLARAKKLDTSSSKTSPFSDLQNKDAYYYGAILAAEEAGYINGYPDGTFRPEATLTRAEMASVVSKAFNLSSNGGNYFKDVPNNWAKKSIESLVTNGISQGYPDGTFKPNNTITRAEFSVMLARAMNNEFKIEPEQKLFVHFLDVGQGDSIFIQTPGGANILIDAGIRSAGEKVVSFLKEKDVGKLDLVVATHPHADHIGGLIPVLNNFKVDRFVDSGNVHTSQTYYEMLTIIDNKDIPFEIPSAGRVYTFDNDFKMTVLHVDSNATNLNNGSVVIKAEYKDVSFMLTGDAESSVETSLLNSNFNLKSTVLKAGHHGSNTSSTKSFLDAVKPEITIISYGEGNQYGHPHDEVLQRLQAIGSKIYATAKSGDITVTTNGKTYTVSANPWTPSIPLPQPDPQPKPEPGLEVIPGAPTSFKNCTEMRKWYPNGVKIGHPAYDSKHDRDKDGWACER